MRGTSADLDRADQADDQARWWALLVVVALLLPFGIVGALFLSGSSTIAKASFHGVPGGVLWAAVAMLEIVSLAGTVTWVFARTLELRDAGRWATIAAGGVTAVAGWSAYGWFGLVGPSFAVGLVHLASLAYRELRTIPRSSKAVVPAVVVSEKGEEVPVEEPTTGTDQSDQDTTTDDQAPAWDLSGPTLGPPTLAEAVRAALARPEPPSERTLADELELPSRHAARKAIRAARTGLEAVSA